LMTILILLDKRVRKAMNRTSVACQADGFTMVTMGGDLQPGCLADRLLNGFEGLTEFTE
jgi:hypothetical protein